MKSIRLGTFETNSSSAHSLIYTPKSRFEDFMNDKLVLQLGGWGVPRSYLIGRGWGDEDGCDGKLLTWSQAKDIYVEWLKGEPGYNRRNYVNLLRWHVRKEIRKPDDITTEDFKKAVEWGNDRKFGNGIVFGTWWNYKQWSDSHTDEYGDPIKSKAIEENDKVGLDFWWFAG